MTAPTTDQPTTDAALLDLTQARLVDLHEQALDPDTTLDSVMTRLFDPDRRELLTYSAFGSAL